MFVEVLTNCIFSTLLIDTFSILGGFPNTYRKKPDCFIEQQIILKVKTRFINLSLMIPQPRRKIILKNNYFTPVKTITFFTTRNLQDQL